MRLFSKRSRFESHHRVRSIVSWRLRDNSTVQGGTLAPTGERRQTPPFWLRQRPLVDGVQQGLTTRRAEAAQARQCALELRRRKIREDKYLDKVGRVRLWLQLRALWRAERAAQGAHPPGTRCCIHVAYFLHRARTQHALRAMVAVNISPRTGIRHRAGLAPCGLTANRSLRPEQQAGEGPRSFETGRLQTRGDAFAPILVSAEWSASGLHYSCGRGR